MPFAPVPVSTEDLVTYLSDKVGTEVNTKQLFEASEHFNCSLATVKKRLKTYKQGIGKWNLTVQEKLEQTYQAPAAIPALEQNLIPDKDPNFIPFGNFTDDPGGSGGGGAGRFGTAATNLVSNSGVIASDTSGAAGVTGKTTEQACGFGN